MSDSYRMMVMGTVRYPDKKFTNRNGEVVHSLLLKCDDENVKGLVKIEDCHEVSNLEACKENEHITFIGTPKVATKLVNGRTYYNIVVDVT